MQTNVLWFALPAKLYLIYIVVGAVCVAKEINHNLSNSFDKAVNGLKSGVMS